MIGGGFLRVNETFCEIVGYARAELLGRTFADITHPDDLAESLDRYTSLMRGETSRYTQEKRYIRQDGSTVWGEVTVSLQHDMAGSANYAIAILQDISERKQAEEALRLANARLDLATRGSNIGIWELDMPDGVFRNGRLDFMNILEQLGHDRDELPNAYESRIALVHPDDRAPFEQTLQGYLDGETRELEIEHRARHKDGSFRWMLTRGVDMRDPEGRPIRLIGSSIDITDHRRAQEALRESEGRFRGTFENAAVGIAQKDADGRFLRVNETYCQIVGYSREELLQRTFQEITHPDDLAAELERYTPLMRGDLSSYSLEKRYLRKDGSLIWIDLSVSLQRDAAGRPDYAIAILQDISQRKRLEEETRRARETAEAANRAKDEFLANVSHEIRTPLNAVLGMTDLVLDTPLTEDQRQCLDTVKSAGESLLSVIADLLDFSKIAAGKLELDPAEFSLRSLIGDTLRALATRAHGKRLELAWHVQPDVPEALVGDAGRLRQVLLNLVGNAIKFTDRGEVVVRVEVDGESPDGEVGLLFSVRDTGIGISRDNQDKIFRAFEQEDTSTTRKYGGTGLGLTIAARLVALMGGKIGVESAPGGAAPSRSRRGSGGSLAARRRLRLDRRPCSATSWCWSSTTTPPTAISWRNGCAAGRWNRPRWPTGRRRWMPSGTASRRTGPTLLVLLDACMPGTSGLALAAMIRERAELAATRIILLSSGDPAGDRARARELNIDAHLLKPVPPDELLATIYRVMSRADGHASPTRTGRDRLRPGRGTAAHPGGRGQRIQHAASRAPAGPQGPQRTSRVQWPRGAGPARDGRGTGGRGRERNGFLLRPSVRSAAPGRPHAGARRLPGHRQDPRTRAGRRVSSARHRLDGPLAPRGPRALPGGRNGRIPRQADPGRGSVRRHRPAGLPARCTTVGSDGARRRREPARPPRLAGCLRRRSRRTTRSVRGFLGLYAETTRRCG